MTHAGQSGRRRWYDKEPRVGKAVEQILTFPDVLQQLLCETLIDYVEDEDRNNRLSEQLHSLGREKVLSLYKARASRRQYDSAPMTRDTLNGIGLLPDSSRQKIAGHIFEMSRIVVRYLKLCKNYNQTPNAGSVSHFFQLYRSGSLNSVEAALEQVRKRFEKMTQRPVMPGFGVVKSPKISKAADRVE